MKLFEEKNDIQSKGHAFEGGFEDMMNARKEHLPQFQKALQEHYKDYAGEMTLALTVREDENGDPTGHDFFIGGVAGATSSLRILKALDEAKDAIVKQLAAGMIENPGAAGSMIEDIITKIAKDKKRK